MARSSPPRRPSTYEVGYGKPPKATRFPRGLSGNPSGRPRRTKTQSAIEKALTQTVMLTIDGKRRRVTLSEAVVLQVAQRALAGNIPATREFLRMNEQLAKARTEAGGAEPQQQVALFINGIERGVLSALEILGIVTSVSNVQQRLAIWAVKAAMARRGNEPLDEHDAKTVRRAMFGDKA